MSWTGWYRPDPGSPWRAVVSGDEETVVFNKLLDTVRGGDKCVLPVGVDPNSASLASGAGQRPDEIRS
jgi:hypothetical protein